MGRGRQSGGNGSDADRVHPYGQPTAPAADSAESLAHLCGQEHRYQETNSAGVRQMPRLTNQPSRTGARLHVSRVRTTNRGVARKRRRPKHFSVVTTPSLELDTARDLKRISLVCGPVFEFLEVLNPNTHI